MFASAGKKMGPFGFDSRRSRKAIYLRNLRVSFRNGACSVLNYDSYKCVHSNILSLGQKPRLSHIAPKKVARAGASLLNSVSEACKSSIFLAPNYFGISSVINSAITPLEARLVLYGISCNSLGT